MTRVVFRICIALSLVGVAGLRLASAQDASTLIELTASDYDQSLDQLALDSRGSGDCSCYECCAADSFFTRPTLTGDWHGRRTCLRESGITFAGRVTQFAFGIEGGINSPVPPPLGQGDTFKYTGRSEYDFIFDLEKFGGLPKGRLLVRAEHWYGDFGGVSSGTNTIIPPVFPAALPTNFRDEGVPVLSNFLFTQPLSERLVVFAGKSDVLGKADQDIFAGGDGTDQFVNQAFIANPAFLLALPYTSFAAGFVMPREGGRIRVGVRDPQDRTKDFFKLNDLFSEGVLVVGEVRLGTNFWERSGEHHVGAVWKHVALPDLSSSASMPGYPYPGTTSGVGTKKDSYTIYYGFDQYLQVFSDNPTRGWGLFGRASISDGNPTPFRYFLSAGIGGDSPLGCHRGDTFGVGWYYSGTSNDFGPLGQALLGPRDGVGVELYYNFQVTPWLNVTPDLQFLRPGLGAIGEDEAFVYGLRVNMTL